MLCSIHALLFYREKSRFCRKILTKLKHFVLYIWGAIFAQILSSFQLPVCVLNKLATHVTRFNFFYREPKQNSSLKVSPHLKWMYQLAKVV